MSAEEYLAWEPTQEERYEYLGWRSSRDKRRNRQSQSDLPQLLQAIRRSP